MNSVVVSVVGTRRNMKKAIKFTADNKEFGLISNVKLTKIAFRCWHLEYEVSQP